MTAVICWAPIGPQWPDTTLAAVRQMIPANQFAAAMRYLNWQDRQARLLGRLALRAILRTQEIAQTLDDIVLTPEGRPSIAGAGDFSIAHTTTLALCAWVRAGRIGIDVETTRPGLTIEDLMPWMSAAERDLVSASRAPLDEALRLWTAKEAVCKADGCGIATDALPDCAGASVAFRGNLWRVRSLRKHGHTISIARDQDASLDWRAARLRNIKLSTDASDLGTIQLREQSTSRGVEDRVEPPLTRPNACSPDRSSATGPLSIRGRDGVVAGETLMLDTLARPPISITLPGAGGGVGITIERRQRRIDAVRAGTRLVSLHLDEDVGHLHLDSAVGDLQSVEKALSATIEALLAWHPETARVDLVIGADAARDGELAPRLSRSGLVLLQGDRLTVHSNIFMQMRGNWLAGADVAPYPLDYALSDGRRHPRRPPKPDGTLYARHIPWLDEAVSFRALKLDDLPLFHSWMNDARVAAFWNESGSIEAHHEYLSKLIADPHMLPLIGCFGDRPFGYFEIYWAKENRIAPFYDADDYDRGWHVAIGEAEFRGRRYISAWLPSLMHYLFLDDPRTHRIVGEPASTHVQQIRNLETSGFAQLKSFDFPHKRATLVMLLRERFFGDRLWLPAGPAPAGGRA